MKIKILVLILFILLLVTIPANACTLYAANGDEWVAGGGTIIAKNRDELPELQDIRLITPSMGFRYLGLFEVVNGIYSTKAGVNEHGLAVVSATAGTIPKKERKQQAHFKNLSRYILTHYKTVEEAIEDTSKFYGPQTLMLADKDKVAYVEIGINGQYAINIMDNGTIAHTNHFLENSMLQQNFRTPGESSVVRYQRITELLAQSSHPLVVDDFVAFSEDRSAGEDNSIWRIGSDMKKPQTLAVFIVHLPPDGMADAYVKIRKKPDDKGNEEIYRLNLADLFNSNK